MLPIAQARRQFIPKQTVSRPDSVLLPGLVNAHTHNPMTLLRGVADDLPLMPWLTQHIWPIEAAVMGPEYVADGVEPPVTTEQGIAMMELLDAARLSAREGRVVEMGT